MQPLKRIQAKEIRELLGYFPGVILLGPRQCGKTTLARVLLGDSGQPGLYLDLENERDRRKLSDANAFLEPLAGQLIILDEVQRVPELFQQLRGLIDRKRNPGRFLLLGSASPELLRQPGESLAGRVAHVELTPFRLGETGGESFRSLWLRGGFPESFLAPSDAMSMRWRDEYIRTFLERDIPQLGFRVPAENLHRLWSMLAHQHGQVLNKSQIGQALGVNHTTVAHHLDILSETFMVRLLPPHLPNLSKRLVKSPKVYLRDSGLLHSLLGLDSEIALRGHPAAGASWEGFALEQVLTANPGWIASHYRTATGVEIDLVLEKAGRKVAFEFKLSSAPGVGRGFYQALSDLKPDRVCVVAPVDTPYPLAENITVLPPWDPGISQ